MNKVALLFIFLAFTSCRQEIGSNQMQLKLQDLETALEEKDEELKMQRMINASMEKHVKRNLIHLVYFDLKENTDLDLIAEQIQSLEQIDVVKDLEFGSFKDLGDKRAMSQFEYVMQMSFDDEQDYKTYQAHEIHLALKKNIGKYLSGPPVTYDYINAEH